MGIRELLRRSKDADVSWMYEAMTPVRKVETQIGRVTLFEDESGMLWVQHPHNREKRWVPVRQGVARA